MDEPIGVASVAGIEPGPSTRTVPPAATLAGWAGILGVACTTASAPLMPIWAFPGSGASGQTIAHFVVDHHDRLLAGMMLNILGVTLWAVLVPACGNGCERPPVRSTCSSPASVSG